MAMGQRQPKHQAELWIDPDDLPRAPSHPFYARLNEILDSDEIQFDRFVEELAAPYYAEKIGRPSLPPSVYVRLLLIGYFEGIDSERGIAWRVADSMALRAFLGYRLTDRTPDHSTISRTRRRLPIEFHREVFARVVQLLADKGLVCGKTVGVDGSTIEANAAMRSIVRRDSGQAYDEFLADLARESGIESPTREDLVRIDKKRKKKTSNKDWENPHDPDAKVTKMKDGRTHLAHKAENAVDMETGAILAAEIHPADKGDTQTFPETEAQASAMVAAIVEAGGNATPVQEVVADKGMHSGQVMVDLVGGSKRSYVSEPDRGRRRWTNKRGVLTPEKKAERDAVYANRRRVRGVRGKALLRKRGELLERTFAHLLDTGGMRRTTLRGRENIAKRYLIQAAAFDLSLIMRKVVGAGKPKWAAALVGVLWSLSRALLTAFRAAFSYVHATALGSLQVARDAAPRVSDFAVFPASLARGLGIHETGL